jgi:hypothetical protein
MIGERGEAVKRNHGGKIQDSGVRIQGSEARRSALGRRKEGRNSEFTIISSIAFP